MSQNVSELKSQREKGRDAEGDAGGDTSDIEEEADPRGDDGERCGEVGLEQVEAVPTGEREFDLEHGERSGNQSIIAVFEEKETSTVGGRQFKRFSYQFLCSLSRKIGHLLGKINFGRIKKHSTDYINGFLNSSINCYLP